MGKPVYDDQKLYEMFLLETFQAGLSWITILHKREAFKEAFDQFDVNKIAMYDDCKINELMNNPKIIRNSRKIKAAVKNAQIFIEIQKEYGSFSKYLWAYTNDKIIYEKKENETTSTLSDQISKDLKKKGMSFVGSITIYSYLEAIGIYNHHDRNCFYIFKEQFLFCIIRYNKNKVSLMQKKRQLKTCIVVVVLMCLLTVSMTFQTICVKTISDNYINSLIVNQIIDLIIDERNRMQIFNK